LGFDDPTAMALLPAEARAEVVRHIANPSRRFSYVSLVKRGAMMVARTIAIDEVVQEGAAPQVVILGAGLDGRAWRMPELRHAVVFEVDHPDSQRQKRAHVAELEQTASEVRFVAVDFSRDDLAEALEGARHDAAQPTVWIWEGVVMYLALPDIERTLAVVQRRSAAGSRIAIVYHCRGWILLFVALFVRLVGEPIRSVFEAEQMRALLTRFGFDVVRDERMPELATRISPELAKDTTTMGHLRVVTAVCGEH
jgi:methyltransferase (TIGR00027 family)